MTHNQIVHSYVLEFGGGALALGLIAVAVFAAVRLRADSRLRCLTVAVAVVLCVPAVRVAAHNRAELAQARADLCVGHPPRFLCGGAGNGGGD